MSYWSVKDEKALEMTDGKKLRLHLPLMVFLDAKSPSPRASTGIISAVAEFSITD
jgi:hypothetical protein